MDSHLVTVEVGVECGTNQRVQLNRFTFYQNRLERLDTQTMQCRGTVQHNRMLFDDVLENVPYLRLEFLDHFLCIFDVMCSAVGNQLFHNERFKQLDWVLAYILMICSGMANSFLDTSITPSCMEIFKENGAIANLFTKFAISMAQFLLPFLITFVAARDMSFRTLYFLAAGIIIVDGIFLAILPFPPKEEAPKAADGTVEKRKMKLTPSAILLVCIGFTASTTFMLFMNCNQELGKLYGMTNPSMIQSFYSAGIICAVLLTAALMKKGLKPIRVLVIYPCVAFCALLLMYFVQIPQICMIGGFLIGYFAAGGVLQLATSTANEMFPRDKGKITAVVMIASSIANYAVLNVASLLSKVGGVEGPRYILLFNAAVTAIGIVFAIILNLRFEKDAQ